MAPFPRFKHAAGWFMVEVAEDLKEETTVTINIDYDWDDYVYVQRSPTLSPGEWSLGNRINVFPPQVPLILSFLKPETDGFWRVYAVRRRKTP
jgi:hypothetical protein